MPASKKIKKVSFDVTKEIANVEKINNPEAEKKEQSSKSVLINIRTNSTLKKHLKSYFASKGLTLSKGLLLSAHYLEEAETRGDVKVTESGTLTLR